MHEFTAAQHILTTACKVAPQHNAKKITEIVIEISKLSHLNKDQLIFCLNIIAEGTIAQDANIVIKEKDIEIVCRSCNYQGSTKLNSKDTYTILGMITCPKCKNRDIQIQGETDCVIQHIQVKQ